MVLGGTEIPDEVLVTGAPAKVKGPIAGTNAALWVEANPQVYRDLAQRTAPGSWKPEDGSAQKSFSSPLVSLHVVEAGVARRSTRPSRAPASHAGCGHREGTLRGRAPAGCRPGATGLLK